MSDVENDEKGDFIIILSSELIAEVMEEYFNNKMFMMAVGVVDLQATESGYAFTLAFSNEEKVEDDEFYSLNTALRNVVEGVTPKTVEMTVEVIPESVVNPNIDKQDKRDKKGRFVRNGDV